MEDRAKLLANIEMDAQLEELRRKQIADQNQRVIAKPGITQKSCAIFPTTVFR